MKKIFLSLILPFLAITGFSQQTPKPAQLDSVVSVSMPVGYQQKDTLDQRTLSANTQFGYAIAIRQANARNNTPLSKASDLNKVFKDIINSIKAQSAGSAIERLRDTTIGALKAKAFILKTNSDGSDGNVQYRDFILLYTQDATYTFEYVYPESRKDLVAADYKAFIGSIKISPQLNRHDQYLSNATGLSSTTRIIIFGGGGLLLILIITLIIKRRKKLAIE